MVDEMADIHTGEDIVVRLQRLQRKRGWEVRTSTAILVKLKKLKVSRKPTLDNLSKAALAQALGINMSRVRDWVKIYGLPARKTEGGYYAIKMADFVEWASNHLDLICDIERDILEWTGIPVETLDQMPPTRFVSSAPRAVRCETGEVFRSMTEAGRAKYVNPESIPRAILRNGTAGGFRWEYVEVKS